MLSVLIRWLTLLFPPRPSMWFGTCLGSHVHADNGRSRTALPVNSSLLMRQLPCRRLRVSIKCLLGVASSGRKPCMDGTNLWILNSLWIPWCQYVIMLCGLSTSPVGTSPKVALSCLYSWSRPCQYRNCNNASNSAKRREPIGHSNEWDSALEYKIVLFQPPLQAMFELLTYLAGPFISQRALMPQIQWSCTVNCERTLFSLNDPG